MKIKHALTIIGLVTGALAAAPAAVSQSTANSVVLTGQSCESLVSLKLPDTTVAVAQAVAAGRFTPPTPFPAVAGPRGGLPVIAAKDLPDFCRVAGVITPTNDSAISFEVWLPTSNWNGKLIGIGNGGFAGSIFYQVMGAPLARGYAVASTDRGHKGAAFDASFASGHPEKLIDFAYRATHETTVKA